jgi:ATP-dependent helicase/nuclease subunit A
MTLTPSQKAAIEPAYSIFVGASAGTGKTFVLTARVLRLLLSGSRPDRILCLTYTKAAAAEMVNRIFETLGTWSLAPEVELRALLNGLTGVKPDDDILDRARSLFAEVLEVPGGLKIQTFHSFCQSLLGRFPLEADLIPGMSVMDERSSAEFLKDASETVMDLAFEEGRDDFAKAFAHMAGQTNEKTFQSVLGAVLGKRAAFLEALQTHGGPEGLIKATNAALGMKPKESKVSILKAFFQAPTFPEGQVRALKGVLLNGLKSEVAFGHDLKRAIENLSRPETAAADYMKVFLTAEGRKRARFLTKGTAEAHPEMAAFASDEMERTFQLSETLKLLTVAKNTESLIRLSAAILSLYQVLKREAGYLDYDDLILKTRSLLDREGIAPWVLYKLDGGLDHILVDEAQDTNHIQWRLVETLAKEFFAGLGAKEDMTRTVFAVGDNKQSIYRFQGAEPEEFLKTQRSLEKKVIAAGQTFRFQELTKSFRSTQTVLDVVDEVFKIETARVGVTLTEEILRHEADRKGMAGLVELWPLQLPDEKPEKEVGWQLPFQQNFKIRPEARLAKTIAGHIRGMIDDGETLKARGRAVRYGDIMILLQKRAPLMDPLIKELKSQNIPVSGSDRMILSDQLVVEDLLALGNFALLPEDDFNLAVVLKGPLLDFDDNDLMDLAIGRNGTLWRALQEQTKTSAKCRRAVEFLSRILSMADFMTPFSFYARILNAMDGRKMLVRRLGPEVGDPLDEFLALCQEFERAQTPSLQGFIKWFKSGETQIKRDMEKGANVVRILTVHGAKGLEAPIVYLPDTYRAQKSRSEDLLEIKDGIWVWPGAKDTDAGVVADARQALTEAEFAESNRLLYVALTRAEDRLYVAGWKGDKEVKGPVWYDTVLEALKANPDTQDLGNGAFRVESEQTAETEDKDKELIESADVTDLPPWLTKAPDKIETGLEALQPSKAEGGLSVVSGEFNEGRAEAIRKGEVIHKLLEHLPELPEAEREGTIDRFLDLNAGALPGNVREDIKNKVTAIFKDKTFQPIFGPGGRAELALMGEIDGKMATGIVDRVVIGDEEILIVDYKSNKNPPEHLKEAPKAYLEQLRLYGKLLEGVYPGRKMRAALLWTETGAWMEVPLS